MPEDKERIPQVRGFGRDSISVGVSPVDLGTTVTPTPSARIEPSILGVDFRSPWLKDRVTLSLEAQIAMMEMRATHRLTLADLGYTNRINILQIREGLFVKIEPTGCYRLVYHNR